MIQNDKTQVNNSNCLNHQLENKFPMFIRNTELIQQKLSNANTMQLYFNTRSRNCE